ncbi:MAG: ABC transporter permease [Muribaculum sp.]|nr:ABC transporter permease [Muribaculaceae bacterium]MCM1080982.1 ABC transporter permease [Muribaculum sp.]
MCTSKLRTALTGLAVAWGIFMLIILVSLAQGVINSFSSSDMAKSPNVIQLWGGYAFKPYHGMPSGRRIELRESNIKELERALPENVEKVSGELRGSGMLSSINETTSKSYCGVFPEAQNQNVLTMKYGRFINEKDLDEQRKVIVLDGTTSKLLFNTSEGVVGKTVKLNDLAFTVIGLYEHDWKNDIYIPYTTAKAISGFNDRISPVRVNIKNVSTIQDGENLEKEIRGELSKSLRFDPDDESALWIWNKFKNVLEAGQAMGILNMTLWIIGLLTLITGVVGVSNIMFVSVRERTHEIGVRRAIGAKPRQILTQVVLESIVLTTVFGYVGIILGVGGTELLNYYFGDVEFISGLKVDMSLAFKVTAVLIVSGAMAGIFPALRALKIKPVEALRTE